MINENQTKEQKEQQELFDQGQWDLMDPNYAAKEFKEKLNGKRPVVVRPNLRKQLPLKKWKQPAKLLWYRKQVKTLQGLLMSGVFDKDMLWYPEEMIIGLLRPMSFSKVILKGYIKPFFVKVWRYIQWYIIFKPQEIFRFGWYYWGLLASLEEDKIWDERMDNTPFDKMSDGDLENKFDRCRVIKENIMIDQINSKTEKEYDHFQLVILEQTKLMNGVVEEMGRRKKMKAGEELAKHGLKAAVPPAGSCGISQEKTKQIHSGKLCYKNCEWLNITEEQQNILKQDEKSTPPHICIKYKKQVLHLESHPDLVRLPECDYFPTYFSIKVEQFEIRKDIPFTGTTTIKKLSEPTIIIGVNEIIVTEKKMLDWKQQIEFLLKEKNIETNG